MTVEYDSGEAAGHFDDVEGVVFGVQVEPALGRGLVIEIPSMAPGAATGDGDPPGYDAGATVTAWLYSRGRRVSRAEYRSLVDFVREANEAGVRSGAALRHVPPCAGTHPGAFTCPRCKAEGCRGPG